MKIAFIGAGLMGEAIISGLLARGTVGAGDISASDVSAKRLEAIGDKYGVGCTGDNREAARGSEVVVLAVKPQTLAGVMAELKGTLDAGQMVLSIVAGASLALIGEGLGHAPVVRAMPNTPAQIGQGITVWTATSAVGEAQREKARAILSALGEEVYVPDEKYIDMATAVSGSGPAYIFLVIESLIDAAVHIGLPRELAEKLVIETALGSARLARQSGQHPAVLRDMVTSPGGTTAEGLLRLEERGLRAILAQAVISAYEKARRLAGGGG